MVILFPGVNTGVFKLKLNIVDQLAFVRTQKKGVYS